jgi:hypothetical protein
MMSLQHKFLFVHIPKTAGNSIQNVLRQYSEDRVGAEGPGQDGVERFGVWNEAYGLRKHSTLAECREVMGEALFGSLFKFCCVRNPWDRAISFYFSPHRGTVSWDRPAFLASLDRLKPCSSYVALDGPVEANRSPFTNVNFVMRYERLDEDFCEACRRIGIPFEPLAVRNKSERGPFAQYYDPELADLVRARFKEDINHFGYEFNPSG